MNEKRRCWTLSLVDAVGIFRRNGWFYPAVKAPHDRRFLSLDMRKHGVRMGGDRNLLRSHPARPLDRGSAPSISRMIMRRLPAIGSVLLVAIASLGVPQQASGGVFEQYSYSESRRAGEVSDPAPDVEEWFNSDPSKGLFPATTSRTASDGNAYGWADAWNEYGSPVLKAHAFSNVYDIYNDTIQATASVSMSDGLYFERNGFSVESGFLQFTWIFRGSINESGGGHATANGEVIVGSGLAIGVDGFPTPLYYRAESFNTDSLYTSNGPFTAVYINDPVLVPNLDEIGALDVSFALDVYAKATGVPSRAEADAGNSSWLFVEYFDEFGNPDPSVTIRSLSGIDYTPRADILAPEPSGLLLAGFGLASLLVAVRWGGRRRARRR